MSTLRFCKQCEALELPAFTPEQMVFKCVNCEETSIDDSVEDVVLQRNNIRQTLERVETLTSSMIFDNSLRRTTHIPCPNKTCPSLNPTEWGKLTSNGIRVQPDVQITNFMSVDKTMTGICRICGQTFMPK